MPWVEIQLMSYGKNIESNYGAAKKFNFGICNFRFVKVGKNNIRKALYSFSLQIANHINDTSSKIFKDKMAWKSPKFQALQP